MRKKFDPFEYDPAAMTLDYEVIETAPPLKKQSKRLWFKFSSSSALRLSSARASGAAWAVLACLLDLEFQAWRKGEPLALSNVVLKEWGISKYRKLRALPELEKLGLVSVKREPRKSPRVTLTL